MGQGRVAFCVYVVLCLLKGACGTTDAPRCASFTDQRPAHLPCGGMAGAQGRFGGCRAGVTRDPPPPHSPYASLSRGHELGGTHGYPASMEVRQAEARC